MSNVYVGIIVLIIYIMNSFRELKAFSFYFLSSQESCWKILYLGLNFCHTNREYFACWAIKFNLFYNDLTIKLNLNVTTSVTLTFLILKKIWVEMENFTKLLLLITHVLTVTWWPLKIWVLMKKFNKWLLTNWSLFHICSSAMTNEIYG